MKPRRPQSNISPQKTRNARTRRHETDERPKKISGRVRREHIRDARVIASCRFNAADVPTRVVVLSDGTVAVRVTIEMTFTLI
jgi:uncharacterized membrane protein